MDGRLVASPAPRDLDEFLVKVTEEEQVVVDTGVRIKGETRHHPRPPIGPNWTDLTSEKPCCIILPSLPRHLCLGRGAAAALPEERERYKEVYGMAAIANLFRAVTYRGREGQIAWMLHRLTGLGVFVFLALHIADVFLMSFGPDVFDSLLFFYHKFLFKLAIVFGLYPGALYHGLNGIRVIIIDFWPDMGRKQATLWRIQMVLFALAYLPSAIVMLYKMFFSH